MGKNTFLEHEDSAEAVEKDGGGGGNRIKDAFVRKNTKRPAREGVTEGERGSQKMEAKNLLQKRDSGLK